MPVESPARDRRAAAQRSQAQRTAAGRGIELVNMGTQEAKRRTNRTAPPLSRGRTNWRSDGNRQSIRPRNAHPQCRQRHEDRWLQGFLNHYFHRVRRRFANGCLHRLL